VLKLGCNRDYYDTITTTTTTVLLELFIYYLLETQQMQYST